jgi:hypothetical protein
MKTDDFNIWISGKLIRKIMIVNNEQVMLLNPEIEAALKDAVEKITPLLKKFKIDEVMITERQLAYPPVRKYEK